MGTKHRFSFLKALVGKRLSAGLQWCRPSVHIPGFTTIIDLQMACCQLAVNTVKGRMFHSATLMKLLL